MNEFQGATSRRSMKEVVRYSQDAVTRDSQPASVSSSIEAYFFIFRSMLYVSFYYHTFPVEKEDSFGFEDHT